MLTVVPLGTSPGGTATYEPSLPCTTAPASPTLTFPVCGACTSTGTTTSADPLMMVTFTEPRLCAVIRPSGVTVTIPC